MNLAFIAVFSVSTTVLAQIRCAKDVTLGGCQATRYAGEHFPNKDMKHWGNDGSEQAVGGRGRGIQMETEQAGRDPVVIICGCQPQEFCYFFSQDSDKVTHQLSLKEPGPALGDGLLISMAMGKPRLA